MDGKSKGWINIPHSYHLAISQLSNPTTLFYYHIYSLRYKIIEVIYLKSNYLKLEHQFSLLDLLCCSFHRVVAQRRSILSPAALPLGVEIGEGGGLSMYST
jgi:hypothetical protein